MELFQASRGIVPAIDSGDMSEVTRLVKATCSLEFVVGYKIGMVLGLSVGLRSGVASIRQYTDLPLIYDHQKFGTDVPELSSGEFMTVFQQASLQGVIVFPQAGVRTLKAAVNGLQQAGIVPIVGGEMTHPGYLESEGGYIADTAPARMYYDAASVGVDHFVVPGTRPESIARYRMQLSECVRQPRFLFPGVGRGQGGDIVEAFRQAGEYPAYAIVGRGISSEHDHKGAAERLWQSVVDEALDRV